MAGPSLSAPIWHIAAAIGLALIAAVAGRDLGTAREDPISPSRHAAIILPRGSGPPRAAADRRSGGPARVISGPDRADGRRFLGP